MQARLAYILTFAILMNDLLKLQAAVTGTVPADGENPVAPVCGQMCCQGQAAVPGIPGLPGQPGPYGPMGQNGEVGFQGPQGDVGKPGELGVPGKLGLRGPPGIVGPTGEIGPKGQKGDQGEAPVNHRVAFAMRRSTHFTSTVPTTLIPFTDILTHEQGTDISVETGTFTCSIPGTYVFMFSVNKYPNSNTGVFLRRNGIIVVSGFSSTSAEYEQISSSALMVLQHGDEVYLTLKGKLYGNNNHLNTFSGFLLYE